jgi:hypothetical protein
MLVESLALLDLALIFDSVLFEGYKALHLFSGLQKFPPTSRPFGL